MALENPFVVYGYVKDDLGIAVEDAVVTLHDTTADVALGTSTTSATGTYQKDIADDVDADGDTVRVRVVHSSGIGVDTFVLDETTGLELVNLNLSPTTFYEYISLADTLPDVTVVEPAGLYLNEIYMDTTRIAKRTSGNTWSLNRKASENYPYVEQTGQQPTSFTLSMALDAPVDRYTLINSLKAALYKCTNILLRYKVAAKYLYGSAQTLWIAPNNINVDEGAGKNLDVTITGKVDPHVIHSCDFVTPWASVMTLSNGAARKGKYSLQAVEASPAADTFYQITCTPAETIDLYSFNNISLWIRTNTTNYYYIKLSIYSGAYQYSQATFPTLVANTWKWCEFKLDDFSDGPMGGAALAAIDKITVSILTKPSPPDNITLRLDDLRRT